MRRKLSTITELFRLSRETSYGKYVDTWNNEEENIVKNVTGNMPNFRHVTMRTWTVPLGDYVDAETQQHLLASACSSALLRVLFSFSSEESAISAGGENHFPGRYAREW
nr:PREDICTED: uncharacterized protein LOC105662796 [Megachile rotundata]